jgi:drug/metabolite transporter (DMT)-like permease
MKDPALPGRHPRPPAWAVLLAFAVLCLSWGTTFLAIREGVKYLPPALFGGTRVTLGGLVLLLYLAWRGERLRLPRRELVTTGLLSVLLFVGGNGLITIGLGERSMASGEAAVLGTTTPLWMALLEACWRGGDRLRWWGWLGVLGGLGGVLLLVPPRDPAAWFHEPGPFLILASAFFWALGSVLVRYQRRTGPNLTTAAYQMLVGGGSLVLTGLLLGEAGRVTPAGFTPTAVGCFFYLLVFGSLVGYLAYTWLLNHTSAAVAGTYAYVTPAIAIVVGWLLAGERVTLPIVGAMVVILASVALVRAGAVHRRRALPAAETASDNERGTSGRRLSPRRPDVPRPDRCGR